MSESAEKCASSWVKYSESKLISLEAKILNVLKAPYKGWFVPIDLNGEKARIWTICSNQESKNTPIVLLHGFGAAVGFWCLNLDALAANRPVYAIDILGFGRSSRLNFSNDKEAERQFVESIELWRQSVGLDKFHLLGHSMGAYLAASYSISHPGRVTHLILADPWGFAEKTLDYRPPLWMKTLGVMLYPFTMLNPLATVRVAGPFGPWIIRKIRSDITHKYSAILKDDQIMPEYIYQCNSQNPTGEAAFHSMIKGFGWAKNPMIYRTQNIPKHVPITIMYGSDTWMDRSIGPKLQEQRSDSYVQLEVLEDSGHHIHADNPNKFNEVINKACNITDSFKSDVKNSNFTI